MRSALAVAGIVGLWTCVGSFPARGDEPRLADHYGFLPLEIYKLDSRVANLAVADLDGDRTDDIILANNGRARLDLLLSGKKGGEASPPIGSGVNLIPNDSRMRLANVSVNKEVVSLQTGDFNGDGKVDLVYYGTPAELVVLLNAGSAKFEDPKRINVGEAIESGTALSIGDLNRDGRDDLALLTANDIVVIYQNADGTLAEPEKLPHTSAAPRILKVVDVDGDGGNDLVILDGGDEAPLRIRLSTADAKLGPERRFKIEPVRAIAFADYDGKPGQEVLLIERQSGRARILKFETSSRDAKTGDSEEFGQLIFYPLPQGSNRDRTLDVGDVDGDGRADVVVGDPANAQLVLYRQGPGGLGTSLTFPGLIGGKMVRLADFDGDKKDEVVVLSEQEAQIGRSTFEDGRLTFPAPLPVKGKAPLAMDIADLGGDKTPEILYLIRKEGANNVYEIRGIASEKGGEFGAWKWGEADSIEFEAGVVPAGLKALDVNQDGRTDILIFSGYGPPVLFLGKPSGPPERFKAGLGPLTAANAAGLTVTTLDGRPTILSSQGSVARSVALDGTGAWQVRDQFNPAKAGAQIQGAAAIDLDGEGTKDIVLWDRTSKSLLALAKAKGNVYRPKSTLPIGAIEFQGTRVADFDGDGRDDLLIAGSDKFGVVLTGGRGPKFRPLADYEPDRKDASLGDLIAGDLNADGQLDIVLTDVSEHFVEIVTPWKTAASASPTLRRALNFPVFEQKSFRGDVDDMVEPRDLTLGDVDGDGRTDLVLLVHDRILIYRQDAGPSQEKKEKDAAASR